MVREAVWYPWWNDYHVARFHPRPLSADLGREFPANEEQHLVAAAVGLGFVATALPRGECHYRGLASLRGLQDFKPLFGAVDVGAFRGHSI